MQIYLKNCDDIHQMSFNPRLAKNSNFYQILNRYLLILTLAYFILVSPSSSLADNLNLSQDKLVNSIWKTIKPDLYFGKIPIGKYSPLLESELYLLRFNLKKYNLKIALASEVLGEKTASVKELVLKTNGIAGINANFFDTNQKPLGLIVHSPNTISNAIHNGGKLLTGIFQIKNDSPSIIHRSDFTTYGVSFAVQAGPRIITDGKLISFSNNEPYSRRSGVALTANGEIVFYATTLRFPGSSMTDIQSALLSTGLKITDALNLDGGGSSQLFIKAESNELGDDISISGGDEVPTALILAEK